jgi:hypothetical protein
MLGVAFFVILNVIMLNGVMVSVVAPFNVLLASIFAFLNDYADIN